MKQQNLNMPYTFINDVVDKGEKGIEVIIRGQNTKGTNIHATLILDEWSIIELASKYAAILETRIVKANEKKQRFAKCLIP